MECSASSTHANAGSVDINELSSPSTSKELYCNADVSNDSGNEIFLLSDDSNTMLPDDSNVILSENDDYVENTEPNGDVSIIDISRLQAIVKDRVEVEVLFKNQYMEPLTFLLLLHDFALEVKLAKLIEYCGGVVYRKVHEIDGYTAVMVKDDSLHWMYLGPVFNVSYIQACIECKRILDISQYFKKSSKLILKKNFNYMRVFYFKKFTWDNIPVKFLLKQLHDKSSENVCSKTNSNDETIGLSNDKNPSSPPKRMRLVNKHTRLLYSRKEDEDILKYVIKTQDVDKVKGNVFWKTMEKQNLCPYRTWQSLKERFLRKLVYNLNSFKFLTDEQIKLLQVCVLRK